VVILASPKTLAHSPKVRLVVIITLLAATSLRRYFGCLPGAALSHRLIVLRDRLVSLAISLIDFWLRTIVSRRRNTRLNSPGTQFAFSIPDVQSQGINPEGNQLLMPIKSLPQNIAGHHFSLIPAIPEVLRERLFPIRAGCEWTMLRCSSRGWRAKDGRPSD